MLDIDNFENLVEDEKILEFFNTKVVPAYKECKNNRSTLEDKWLTYIDMWAVLRSEKQRYDDEGADIRQPTIRRQIETIAKKNYQAFFGGGTEYFTVTPSFGSMGATIDDAESTKNLIKHFFDGETNIKQKMFPHFRQKVALGTSVIKIDWSESYRKIKRRGKGSEIKKSFPRVYPVDLFKWYGFPDNVRTIDELSMTFEEFFRDEYYVKSMKDKGFYSQEFTPGANTKVKNYDQDRASRLGMNPPNTNSKHGNNFYNLVEVYFIYHDEDCVEHMMLAHMTEGGEVAMICYSPFEHGEFPYAIDKYLESLIPSLYGSGYCDAVSSQYHELNDVSNQMMDSRTRALNPITIIDPNAVKDYKSIKVGPGAIWLADPKGVSNFAFPDLSISGANAFNLIKNEIIEASDSVPNLPPQMRGASRTATRDNAMQVEMNSELSEIMQHSGNMCTRMLKLTHANLIQYMEDDMVIRINKKKSAGFLYKTVTVDDVNCDLEFNYKNSQNTSLDRVAINQLTNVVKIAAAFPNVKLKTENILRRMLVDGFGFEDFEEIMESDSLAQDMPQELENKILKIGKKVPVSINDDDLEHIKIMQAELMTDKKLRKAATIAIEDHLKRHTDAYNLKQSVLKQQMMMAMQEQYAMANGQPQQQQGGGGQTMMKQGSEADRTGTMNTSMEQSVNNG